MGRITLQQAAQWCGGRIDPKYKDITFLGANMDSRKIEAGQLFIALKGERDGHDFIGAALEKGAAAVLCTHCDGDYPAIVVEDTRIALGDIARGERIIVFRDGHLHVPVRQINDFNRVVDMHGKGVIADRTRKKVILLYIRSGLIEHGEHRLRLLPFDQTNSNVMNSF